MPRLQPFAWICLLLFAAGCLPPWTGEECNFPVVKVNFFNPNSVLTGPFQSLDSTGITRVYHLERDEEIRLTGWQEVPNMRFSRYDPTLDLLLPLDVEAEQSTFILERPGHSDTLFLTYQSRLGMAEGCGYTFILDELEVRGSDSLDVSETYDRHPRILAALEVLL